MYGSQTVHSEAVDSGPPYVCGKPGRVPAWETPVTYTSFDAFHKADPSYVLKQS